MRDDSQGRMGRNGRPLTGQSKSKKPSSNCNIKFSLDDITIYQYYIREYSRMKNIFQRLIENKPLNFEFLRDSIQKVMQLIETIERFLTFRH